MTQFRLFFLIFFLIAATHLLAQESSPDTCIYKIQFIDFFGDGWNGASLTVSIGGESETYSLVDSTLGLLDVKALKNESLQISFNQGPFDEEISYIVYDPDGAVIFNDGPSPLPGLRVDIIACPSCPVPEQIEVNEFVESALISWEAIDNIDHYLIEYGPSDFSRDSGIFIEARDTFTPISGLEAFTKYDFYLSAICMENDSSRTAQKGSFATRYAKDVGIEQITMPTTSCGLTDTEMIEIQLKNFGANPQSLIPFRFSVNGMDGGVSIPMDGFYTGILSKDASVTIEFETTYDFSQVGSYDIAVWTELEGDNNSSNDTAYLTVVNIPNISTYPYQQSFDGAENGWTSTGTNWKLETSKSFSGQNAWLATYRAEGLSYLVSPCIDFSNFENDPKIAFRLFADMVSDEDQLWLEISTNNGSTWKRVIADSTAYNWYNNSSETAWAETGGFSDWGYVENTLKGTAGKENVRLRFVFESSLIDPESNGIAIDDVHIFVPTSNNLVAISVVNSAPEGCGSQADQVNIQIYNAGMDSLHNFEVNYQINNGPIINERAATTIAPRTMETFQFERPFNSSNPDIYRIAAWVSAEGDKVNISDTVHFILEVVPPLSLPLIEDFEDQEVADGWLLFAGAPGIYPPNDHNNDSYILSDNMWFGNPVLEFVTTNYGPINIGDSLSFDYRFTLWEEGAIPLELDGDLLEIGISTDCGASFTPIWLISELNHRPTADFTNVKIDLSEYAGQGVRFRVFLQRSEGDYWFDMDNITILSCPPDLGLSAAVTHLSAADASDGSIKITPLRGSGQYIYDWIGDTTAINSISNLLSGIYKVIVTDAIVGCTDSLEVEVGFFTATQESEIIENIRLFPNPTTSFVHLETALQSAAKMEIQVLNPVGQVLFRDYHPKSKKISQSLDLSNFAQGIYFIRIQIGAEVFVKKLLKVN